MFCSSRKICIQVIILLVIFAFALLYRVIGISTNHSFWVDEMQISNSAKEYLVGSINLFQLYSRLGYQIGYVLLTSTSYALFGFGETQARIFSVLFGSLSVVISLYVARQYTRNFIVLGTIALLQTTSTMLLAQSTQNKPYTIVATFCLLFIYFTSRVFREKVLSNTSLIIIGCMSIIAGLIHQIGFLLIYPLTLTIVIFRKNAVIKLLMIVIMAAFTTYLFSSGNIYNHYIHVKNLFLRQYFALTFLTAIWLYVKIRKRESAALLLVSFCIPWIISWNFIPYTHNIRYITPVITVLMLFAPLSISELSTHISKKWRILVTFICCAGLILSLAIGKKITIFPKTYYSPNIDFYGDVQTADYKGFIQIINKSGYNITNSSLIVPRSFIGFDYGQLKPDLYLQRSDLLIDDSVDGVRVVSTLKQLMEFLKKHPSGYMIVEKWHSYVPDDVQEYAAQHMEKLIEVDSLPQTPDDPWPLILYRWGYNSEKSLPL